jgi:hypothetical protein
LYERTFFLELDALDQRHSFVRLKVYTAEGWTWINYPVKYSRYFEQRRTEAKWELQSPKLMLRPQSAELHFPAIKAVKAQKVFVTDQGLDQQRYRHLKRISHKQWLSGKPVKGEHSSRQLRKRRGQIKGRGAACAPVNGSCNVGANCFGARFVTMKCKPTSMHLPTSTARSSTSIIDIRLPSGADDALSG